MGIKIAMIGTGLFAQCFIPLFKAHPLVDQLMLCDLDSEKLHENSVKHGIGKTSRSLDDVLSTDVDAVVIITQNWMHAPQAIKALKAGKHVYSAVPAGVSIKEIEELVRTVEETGKIYMMGETTYYMPCTIYCRDQYKNGKFGKIVYGEGEYYHDMEHGLYDVYKIRGGEEWKKYAGSPPMYYPTHSNSAIIGVTGAHMTHVSCQGFNDKHVDGVFVPEVNMWSNSFSNQTALFKMSDGSCCRINEFRRIGHPGAVRMSLFGTEGCYEENSMAKVWLTKNFTEMRNLNEILECRERTTESLTGIKDMSFLSGHDGTHMDISSVHPVKQLPKEFTGLPNGHSGSHQFLVDDFVKACVNSKTPPNSVWEAARYTIPGIIAHESAIRGGELLEIPDYGDPR